MNPFEMRYAIFHAAKDLVETQYKAALASWDVLDKTTKEAQKLMPKVPTLDEVMETAIEINKFVSDANEKEIGKVAKHLSGIGSSF